MPGLEKFPLKRDQSLTCGFVGSKTLALLKRNALILVLALQEEKQAKSQHLKLSDYLCFNKV